MNLWFVESILNLTLISVMVFSICFPQSEVHGTLHLHSAFVSGSLPHMAAYRRPNTKQREFMASGKGKGSCLRLHLILSVSVPF